jgi:phosphinothricin acetyltransferase
VDIAALTVRPAIPADVPGILALLESCGLPRDGFIEHLESSVVAEHAGAVVGCAAVELYDASGLLRSVAVAQEWRGLGTGHAVCWQALALAERRGVARLYLLTETAEAYFHRFGFRSIERDDVEPSVRASVEFSSACPASARAMLRVSPPPTGGALRTRLATPADSAAIASIYNQGIEDRVATFETRLRVVGDVEAWFDGVHPTVLVEDDLGIVAFASTSTYRPRDCYAGIAEFSVYVARRSRRRGAGKAAMEALIDAAERAGYWKLVSRVFVENTASRRLLKLVGFREVGVYERHAKLDGVWRDVVIVERLLDSNIA